jgi:hypothetical protein
MPVMRSHLSLSTSLRSFVRPTWGLISSSSRMISILRPAIVPPIWSKYICIAFRFAFPSAANTLEKEFSTPMRSGARDCDNTAGARPRSAAPDKAATPLTKWRRPPERSELPSFSFRLSFPLSCMLPPVDGPGSLRRGLGVDGAGF